MMKTSYSNNFILLNESAYHDHHEQLSSKAVKDLFQGRYVAGKVK